jgi:uncharacterized protein
LSTRVVVIGDTHMPRFGRVLPGPLVEGLRAADLILHVGDMTDAFVLDLLAAFAPVEAVAGNNDPPELVERLGHARVVEVEQLRVGLTHGYRGPGRTTPERAWRTFESWQPPIDAICFGHSHQPLVEQRDGIWLLNPGSPTDRRREPSYSFLTLDIDGRALRPELVRYGAWRERR